MIKFLDGIKRFYNKAEEYLLVSSLALTVILVFAQVVMRKIFNQSISWSEELCRYIFIWQIWFGVSLAFRNKQHIAIEMVTDKLNGKSKIIYQMVANIITLGFNIFLMTYGFKLVSMMIGRGAVSSGLRVPLYIVYLAVPLSSLVIVFRLVGQIFGQVQQLKNVEGSEV